MNDIKQALVCAFRNRFTRAHAFIARHLPDELYLRMVYRRMLGKSLRLNPPVTFNEKMQWLKLHDRKTCYTTYADKLEARKIVSQRLGARYLVPLLGVWGSAKDIDFDALPERFVLKCTHDSGSVIVCRDKGRFDRSVARARLSARIATNYFWYGREWCYKNIVPKIIAEEYLCEEGKLVPEDYKVYCFNGEPKLVVVFHNRFAAELSALSESVYNTRWEQMPCSLDDHFQIELKPHPKPECLDELLVLARLLSDGTAFMRADFYVVKGRIYFGEMTMYSASGFAPMVPASMDEQLGERIVLPTDLKKRAPLRNELSPAKGYAERLAKSLWEKHYRSESPDWKPLDNLMGVLTQIDNMVSDLTRKEEPWRPANEPPKETEWVIASADGAVRCVAWDADHKTWEDWDGVGHLAVDAIEWWMPIPNTPGKEKS